MHAIVAFDDTGSPGIETPSSWLNSKRKSYVGVILLPEQVAQLTSIMNAGIQAIKYQFNISEFHLTDIMNGTAQWRHVSNQDRFDTFMALCNVFSKHYIPCVTQTWSPEHYSQNNINIENLNEIENLKKENYEHFAFYVALMKSVKYLYDQKITLPARFFCDEGIKKQGTSLHFSFLNKISTDSDVKFERSMNNIYLQIADFAAYCFNKSQIIAVKETKTDSDWKILEQINKSGFDFLDATMVFVSKEQLDSQLYDYLQWQNHSNKHNG
ncbi:DUF3800 domain-containing protein [Cellvibrio sp. OA-2007]|uniref:DUF3800 domain-containing protein n=1 Tax=Cellvibrio sp. OA-2007 TaxID=529823 RepID=UPI0007816098|nr:DUF3800 domain-containing protein [Cellvibrio sp. OA-2007]